MKRFLILFVLLISGCTAINKVTKFYDQGDYDTAIRECQVIIASDSLNAKAHLLLGRCYSAQGKLEKAVQSLKTAYELKPATSVTNKAKLELITAQLNFADSLFQEKDFRKALAGYKYVLELDSTHVPGALKLGGTYYETGLLTKSREMYQRVLQDDEDNIVAIKRIQDIDNRTAEAEDDYEAGREYFVQYKYESALTRLEKALKNEPDHYDAQYFKALAKGCILYNKGGKNDLWDAIEEFGTAMAIRPAAGEPHYYLALAYEKKDRREFDNAIQEYQKYLDKEPNGEFAGEARKKIKELKELRDRLKDFWGK